MDRTLGRSVAWTGAAASLVLTPLGLLIQLRLPVEWQPDVPLTSDFGVALTFPLVGAFLVTQRPRLSLAWLMCGGGLLATGNVLFTGLMFHSASRGELAAAGVLRWFAVGTWAIAGVILAIMLPLYSPTGRLAARAWRPVVVMGVAATIAEVALSVVRPDPDPAEYAFPVVIPNPLQVRALAPYYTELWTALGHVIQACVVAALLSLLVRIRGADSATRRQIAWPLGAFTGYVVFYVLGESMWLPAIMWTAIIPIAILFSALRHRLYGIDTAISRAFVGAGLLTAVSGVYFGVGALSSLLVSEYHQVAGLAAALFAGAFFQPLRRVLQRVVDWLLYGKVGDPRSLAERLTQEVRRADPAEALTSVVTVVRDGLAVEGAAVEVTDGRPRYVESGDVGDAPREIPLVWHGEPVGRLLIGRPGARRFGAAHDERVIATLLPYAADVAHAVRMAADLQRSRERVLATREEERRRLRRDLHDGLGQTLGAMAMTINMARLSLARSPSATDGLLRDLRTGMDAVAGDIRELVYGLRPPVLDDLGLAEAVRTLAEETLPAASALSSGSLGSSGSSGGDGAAPVVRLDVRGDVEGLPAAVEVAVYRIVQEALTNVRRHAQAAHVRVVLQRVSGSDTRTHGAPGQDVAAPGGEFVVRVEDDGIGMPERPRAGVGTSSMRERAAELGGTCVVTSPHTGGTLIEARFPIPS